MVPRVRRVLTQTQTTHVDLPCWKMSATGRLKEGQCRETGSFVRVWHLEQSQDSHGRYGFYRRKPFRGLVVNTN